MAEYKINNINIEDIYERFPLVTQNTYGVTDSAFTDSTRALFKWAGAPLKDMLEGSAIPTSAGASYLGGENLTSAYKVGGSPIDCALKGCRPIGIPVADLEVGTYYINRVGGQTWLSSSAYSATGTRLNYDPKYLHIELQGGGGGGASSSTIPAHASSGGGAGGYLYAAVALPENSYLRIEVGAGGESQGTANRGGNDGSDTTIYDSSGNVIAVARGGTGGINNKGSAAGGVSSGGIFLMNGANGGNKETVGYSMDSFSVTLSKPETYSWSRGGTNGGTGSGNSVGGGGGASAFANGATGYKTEQGDPGTLGSGGAGGGYNVAWHSGGAGGDGLAKLYY